MAIRELGPAVRRVGLSFVGSGQWHRTLASWGRNLPLSTSGLKTTVENRCRDFFSDPSEWWDFRSEKENPRYPDFKHKITQEGLWLDGKLNPPWVQAELSAMAPGTVQSTLFSWNTRLTRYIEAGEFEKTIEMFQQMQQEGISPNRFTFVPLLKACASLRALEEGRRIHDQIICIGCESDIYVGSSLVDMYAKCGSLDDAHRVFNKLPTRNVVSWNAMIHGHVKCGQGQKALELFQHMQQQGLCPNPVTFVGLLNACASVGALEQGRRFHEQIIQRGCQSDVFVGNSLVDMYSKCGSIDDAWRVFNKMPICTVVCWNSLILGHVKCGHGEKALELSRQMQRKGVDPDSVTFVGMINACASIGSLEEGRRVHEQITQNGYQSDIFVGNSLIDMYAKCGSIEDAWIVFNNMPQQNVVSWTAMIHGHVKCGQGRRALELFEQMQDKGVKPAPATFVGVLNACASLAALEEGRCIHELVIQSRCQADVFVGSSIIDMYTKCGSIDDARRVFSNMPTHNVVSWNAIILGHAKCGQGEKALELSLQMQQQGVDPDPVTFVGLLNACTSIGALEEGMRVHEQIIQTGCQSDVFVSSSLVDMYAKCGSIENAYEVFNEMPTDDVVVWNTMLGGYAVHGHANRALGHFEHMCNLGIEIDAVTLINLLLACSHGGLVDEGLDYFESMGSVYHISPTVEHYGSLVGLLGLAGRLHEAEDVIKTMSYQPDATVWISLLGACRVHGCVDMGERIAEQVLELDPGNVVGYVLLSNIYAAAGKWDSSAVVQQQRLAKGVKKQPGCTWIEVNNQVHSFLVNDLEHPQILEIHAALESLYREMEEVGYEPDIGFVLHDVEEEEKVSRLSRHSEKLAIAFGLISTPPGTPLRIFKNLRVCGDCHSITKFIAQTTGRTIIVRDVNCFHHFSGGVCSCRDYW